MHVKNKCVYMDCRVAPLAMIQIQHAAIVIYMPMVAVPSERRCSLHGHGVLNFYIIDLIIRGVDGCLR